MHCGRTATFTQTNDLFGKEQERAVLYHQFSATANETGSASVLWHAIRASIDETPPLTQSDRQEKAREKLVDPDPF